MTTETWNGPKEEGWYWLDDKTMPQEQPFIVRVQPHKKYGFVCLAAGYSGFLYPADDAKWERIPDKDDK